MFSSLEREKVTRDITNPLTCIPIRVKKYDNLPRQASKSIFRVGRKAPLLSNLVVFRPNLIILVICRALKFI